MRPISGRFKTAKKENAMFFKKDEKDEPKTETKEVNAAPKTKVIYRIEDKTGQGDWDIQRAEVSKDQALAANEFPKILAAQKAVFEDLSSRITRLKEVRSKVKSYRRSLAAKESA
jgi:hypothetical protein